MLDFNLRQSRSQGGMRSHNSFNNPITHSKHNDPVNIMKNSGNLWYHQREEKDEAKRKAQVFLDGLNEQRKLEKQRKLIDQKFEALNEYKILQAKNERLAKEDEEREDFRRRFEEASKQNDVRVNHYLSNYYLPPEEKELRNNVSSQRMSQSRFNRNRQPAEVAGPSLYKQDMLNNGSDEYYHNQQ